MRKFQITTVGLIALAGCQATTTSPTPMPTPVPVAAGYADGTKDIFTEGLVFSTTAKALHLSGGALDLQNYNLSYRYSAKTNQYFAIINGQEIALTYSAGSGYQGSNSNYSVSADYLDSTADNQVELTYFRGVHTATGEAYGAYVAAGLPTNPTQVAALSGTATFTGTAILEVLHDTGSSINFTGGSGTATINADFGTGIVSGAMSITDDGTSDTGYAMSATTILIDPTAMTGNGFSSTLTVVAADLAMNSVTSSALDGTFFGVNAADVGGSFSALGISNDGTSAAYLTGGFIGE